MKLVYDYNSGQFSSAITDMQARLDRAGTAAITETTDLARTAARASVAAGMGSNKWANAVRSKIFPQGHASLKAAGFIYSKIPYADVFQTGATISAANGLLWLPLPSVPIRQGGHRLTPKQYIQFFGGPLKSVNLPGKPPMLFGRISRQGVLRVSDKAARLSKRARKTGQVLGAFVPLFVGVPAVKDPQKFDVKNAIALVVSSTLNDSFLKNLED